MNLTETNKLWLERAAWRNAAEPEAFLNEILKTLRGRDEGGLQTLDKWIGAAGEAKIISDELRADITKTRVAAEEAVRAARTYLGRIPRPSTPS